MTVRSLSAAALEGNSFSAMPSDRRFMVVIPWPARLSAVRIRARPSWLKSQQAATVNEM